MDWWLSLRLNPLRGVGPKTGWLHLPLSHVSARFRVRVRGAVLRCRGERENHEKSATIVRILFGSSQGFLWRLWITTVLSPAEQAGTTGYRRRVTRSSRRLHARRSDIPVRCCPLAQSPGGDSRLRRKARGNDTSAELQSGDRKDREGDSPDFKRPERSVQQ
jgi:hypothetical protein